MNETIARSQPCPCGSGKKYKRCCGVSTMPGGIDPGQIDPNVVQQFTQAFSRLPQGQRLKFQQVMQKAMAGQDVTREAEALHRSLPPEFQEMLHQFVPVTPDNMSLEEARRVVQEAAARGDIDEVEATELLKGKV